MEGSASPSPTPGALPYYVAFSQLLGLTVVAVTGAWLGLYRGGIAWESALQFNVHPLCMVIGMVFLQGDALLVYRVFRKEAKRTTKVLHGLLHVFAFIIALVGLVAVFDYHKKKGYADLYSLHSWCGLLVFVLYFVQLLRRENQVGEAALAWQSPGQAGGKRLFCHRSGLWASASSCSLELHSLSGAATALNTSSLEPPSSSCLWAQPYSA